ncbi:hypothetical protein Fmac_001599 [Flemingia macrophylla]|uniref:DUF1639 family protein n=1 Tax=Flemingia macrophylla TaxID=520843 RepID=A0ABD1NHL7_9FABA
MTCTAAGSGGDDHSSSALNSNESNATRSKESGEKQRRGDDDDGIAVVRRRLILDLKTETNRMKDAIFRSEEEAVRPWNLRKRQAKVEVPVPDGKKRNHSPPARHDGASRVPQLRSASDKTEKVKFSKQLSRKEIEEDFMAMSGQRPPRRPNKRPKLVQKQLDALCPGLWLTEVTADSYKVIEAPENGKVRHNGKRKVDAGF